MNTKNKTSFNDVVKTNKGNRPGENSFGGQLMMGKQQNFKVVSNYFTGKWRQK